MLRQDVSIHRLKVTTNERLLHVKTTDCFSKDVVKNQKTVKLQISTEIVPESKLPRRESPDNPYHSKGTGPEKKL